MINLSKFTYTWSIYLLLTHMCEYLFDSYLEYNNINKSLLLFIKILCSHTHPCITYSTAQMQVDGLTRVWVFVLEYLRANTHVKYTSGWHEQDMMPSAMSSNRQVESCDKFKFARAFFKYLRILASLLKNSQLKLSSVLLTSINLHLSGIIIIITCICMHVYRCRYNYMWLTLWKGILYA